MLPSDRPTAQVTEVGDSLTNHPNQPEETGLPSTGFSAASAGELAKKQLDVFAFDWIEHGAPKPAELEQAVKDLTSRGE